MRKLRFCGAALACAAMFSACGGGGDAPVTQAGSGKEARAEAASVVPQTVGDVIFFIRPVAGDTTNNLIQLSDAGGNDLIAIPLDTLPSFIASLGWVASPANALGHLRFRFDPGVYRFTQGWVWPVGASGHDANHQIVLEKASSNPDHAVILQGSVRRSANYAQGAGNISLNPSISRSFEQLWTDDGTRAIRARKPNVGQFYRLQAGASGWPMEDTGPAVVGSIDGASVGVQAFLADDDAYAAMASMKADNDTKALVMLMHKWQVSRHHVKALDGEGKRVRIAPPIYDTSDKVWYLGGGPAQRYFLENRLSYVDSPGEWYWSGSTLTYRPLSTLQAGTVNFEVPQVEKLLAMSGAPSQNKFVQYVQFSGLKFRYTKVDTPVTPETPDGAYLDGQADAGLPAAIELNDARYIQFVNCEVSHTGGYAFWLNKQVKHVRIEGSELYDLGAGGVKIGRYRTNVIDSTDGADLSNVNATGQNIVQSNRIHAIGHAFPGAVGIWVGRSSNNQILGNLVKDTTYSGISVGWTWSDTTNSLGHHNIIAGNFLEGIGQGALADLGGIYLLGRAPGTQVESNVIKDVRGYAAYGEPARGIYLDQASSLVAVNRNLVYGVAGEGLFLHNGENNTVYANTFANVGQAFGVGNRMKKQDLTESTAVPITLTDNVFYPRSRNVVTVRMNSLMSTDEPATATWLAPGVPVLAGNEISERFVNDGQLVIPPLCSGCSLDMSSTVTDPGPLKRPVTDNGYFYDLIREWTPQELTATASAAPLWTGALPYKKVDFRAKQWLTSDNVSVTEFPVQRQYYPQTAPVLSIADDASGVRHLAITDASRGGFHIWEPFTLTEVNYPQDATATATVSFRASFDDKANFVHAWRSDAAGNKTGPWVRFIASGSSILVKPRDGASVSLPVPIAVNTWHDYTITSKVGGSGQWTLSIDGVQVGTYAPIDNDWNALKFVMFASYADTTTKAKLASIQISRQ